MSRLSITTRLVLSFLAIIIITTTLFMVLTNRVLFTRFSDLVVKSGNNFSRRAIPIFERYYQTVGSWEGVEEVIFGMVESHEMGMGRNRPETAASQNQRLMITAQDERLILLNENDQVVFDSNPGESIINDPEILGKFGIPISVDNKRVGTLLVASSMGLFSESQNLFLREVNQTLLWAALIAILLVLIVAVLQSRLIVQPLRQMSEAAMRLAKGDYNQRVDVHRNDELGDMSNAFNLMASELAQQAELRRQLMADVAHELRTPLSVLRIDLESMEDGLMEVSPENVRNLQSEVSYLSNLVDDLRMLSMADAGDLKIEKSPVELNSLVREMVERQQFAARDRKINLKSSLMEKDIYVFGDHQRLSQVLVNLLTNAIQHTPPDNQIFITTEKNDKNAIVKVKNLGTWIPGDELERIFDRFYRLDRSRNRNQGGSGLGLSIARSMVEAHGGKIWAESVEGQSTTFIFTLPMIE